MVKHLHQTNKILTKRHKYDKIIAVVNYGGVNNYCGLIVKQ